MYAALLGLLFFVYRIFPNTRVPARAAATAPLVVATLWEIARRSFAAYLTDFGAYGKLYGSFGVIAATIGLQEDVLDGRLFSAVLLVVVASAALPMALLRDIPDDLARCSGSGGAPAPAGAQNAWSHRTLRRSAALISPTML